MNTLSSLCVPHPDKVSPTGCISLVGMAAAGKTTVGRELSLLLGWPQIDSDHLIESIYGAQLNDITISMTKEEFLDIEANTICAIGVKRTVISTGGSAIYRERAMQYLGCLGPIIYLAVPLPIILERIARKPERGLAIAPGQTIECLYNERATLYEKFATHIISGGDASPATYARQIAEWLLQKP